MARSLLLVLLGSHLGMLLAIGIVVYRQEQNHGCYCEDLRPVPPRSQ